MTKWKSLDDVKKKWMKDPEFKESYDDLCIEFELARILIKARTEAGLTQSQVAERMNTTQSVIARIESGNGLPILKTLHKFALATGKHMHVLLD